MALEITPRDIDILRNLLESRILTAAHISIHHFDGKTEATKKRIQKLKAANLIAEQRTKVSAPAILSLTTKGIRLLDSEGILTEYPSLSIPALQKRTRVSEQTIRHELDVLDVKASFHRALCNHPKLTIKEFSTWPACYEFRIHDRQTGRERLVQPDGFIRVHEEEPDGGLSEHAFFLEVDRSTEVQDRLVQIARCYQEYYASGGFAEWSGGGADNPAGYPFRVLMVFKTTERRNNCAQRLLQNIPPILTRVWLSTIDEVKQNPLNAIWVRPRDYRDSTSGTPFDLELKRQNRGYSRQKQRELILDSRLSKVSLFET